MKILKYTEKKKLLSEEREKAIKKPGSYLLSHGQAAVPSARGRFTSVFGMGTGVAALLWPPGVRMEARDAVHPPDASGTETVIWPSLSEH